MIKRQQLSKKIVRYRVKMQKDCPNTIYQLKKKDQNTEEAFLDSIQSNDSQEMNLLINQLSNSQGIQPLTDSLQMILQISERLDICLSIYNKLSMQLIAVYRSLLQKQKQLAGDQQKIKFLDSIFKNIIQCHIHQLFIDQIGRPELYFYDILIGLLDLYLEKGYSEQKIGLLELILEYFQINDIKCSEPIKKILMKKDRKQAMRYFIDENKGVGMGHIFSELLAIEPIAAQHSDFWLAHKQHFIHNIINKHQNTSYLKFLKIYLKKCQSSVFNEHQFEDMVGVVVHVLEQQINDMNPQNMITSSNQTGTLKLRKIKYCSLILQSLNINQLQVSNNIMYEQQDIIIKLLMYLLYYRQFFSDQHFKQRYLQQIIVTATSTLPLLYKNHYYELPVHGQDLIQHFPALMEIQESDIKVGVCQIMRVLLLKKEVMMANCQSLAMCKQYVQWLPLQAQEHVIACGRIQQLLFENNSIEQQYLLYFQSDYNHQKPINPQLINNRTYTQKTEADAEQSSFADNEFNIINHQISPIRQKSPWTEDQLIYSLNNIGKQDSRIGIKTIVQNLSFLENPQYASLLIYTLLDSQRLFQIDKSDFNVDLAYIQKKIVQHIPQSCISFDKKFYQMLNLNEIGASICLRKREIGLRGLQILCNKFMKQCSPAEYAQMISVNAAKPEQLRLLYNYQVYKIVNKKLPLKMKDEELVLSFLKLIIVTCKLKAFQEEYEVRQLLIRYLMENALSLQMIRAVLQALIQLTDDCGQNRKIMQETAIVSFLGEFIKEQQNYGDFHEIHMLIYGLLANLLQYNATAALQYSQIHLQERIVLKLKNQLQKSTYQVNHFKVLLRILEVLSLAPLSCIRLLKTNFLPVCISVTEQATTHKCYFIIKTTLMIIYHLIQSMSSTLDQSINQLDEDTLLQYLYSIRGVICQARGTQIYLEIFCKILNVPSIIQKTTKGKIQILKVMSETSKSNECTILIIEKWIKVLFLLLEGSRLTFATDIVENNIFYDAACCLSNHSSLTQSTINKNVLIIRQISDLQMSPKTLVKHGFADFLVMNLKMKNLQLQDYFMMLTIMFKLQKKATFSIGLSSKLFEIVMSKLQFNWDSDVSAISLAILKAIKKNLDITNQVGQSLFQFFGSFLTQSGRVTSAKYFAISKQVINLMSYCIIFHGAMRGSFKNGSMVPLLKNWLRDFKSSAVQQLQTYKLFIYSIYNEQALLVDISEVSKDKMIKIQNVCELGWKCNLFRLNGSFKQCTLRLDICQQYFIAYKWPDGEIKAKYRLPIRDIVVVHNHKHEKDVLFQESCFTRSSNLFQKSVNPTRCTTILCLCEESNQIRQTSVQFQNINDLMLMTDYLRILISRSSELQKQKLLQVQTNKNQRYSSLNQS